MLRCQGKHQACIEACSRILASEASNRKALYRRGQAHLAASEAPAAVRDLRKALAAAPADEREIIRGKLEAAQKLLASQGLAAEPEEEQIEEIKYALLAGDASLGVRKPCKISDHIVV